MPRNCTSILRARAVLPISSPAIQDGAVCISGDRISAIGRWKDFATGSTVPVTDLGEVLLLPGLVNAHCHLDYTLMAGQLHPTKSFVDWIQLITTCKADLIYSDFAQSWLNGAKMLLHHGTTTVGDVEMVPELLPDVWTGTPLRVVSFLEMTGVKSRRPPAEILGESLSRIESLKTGRSRCGLSPHAPYSTTNELLKLSAGAARQRGLIVTTHVGESAEEFEMFARGKGKMHGWIARSGRDMSDCGKGSPVQILEQTGILGGNFLAVHANYLAPGDAALLGGSNSSVAHCPRSHDYFKHAAFPFEELEAAGVNICLGTDSLATLYRPRKQPLELDMFAEMRQFAKKNPDTPDEKILRMATMNGAQALGMRHRAGELVPGAFADMIALPFAGDLAESYEAVVHHRGGVLASMIEGQWAIAPARSDERNDFRTAKAS